MNKLDQLYVPLLQQLRVKSVARDENRCFATFDGTVCSGEFIAVKADEGCLITRYRVRMHRDFTLTEYARKSLVVRRATSNFAALIPANKADVDPGVEGQIVSVFLQLPVKRELDLKAGDVYEITRITYLPEYFDTIDLPMVGGFDDVTAMVPNLDEELLSLRLRGLLEDLDLGAAQRPTGTYYYRSKALQALCHVMDMVAGLSRLRTMGASEDDQRLVRQVMEIVESSLDDLPSIHELSHRLYVGHTHLCETFKSVTGMTIGEYARKRRIESAQVLLRDPDLPIKEIACRVGFHTTGGFSASFRQLVGMTPRQYRLACRH